MILTRYKVGFVLVVIYLLTFIITYFNPMQSDDFAFYFKGLSIQEHMSFYMTWSGRVVVDYLATLILAINNHFIIALICSLALPLLIYNITTIPYYKEQQTTNNKSLLILAILILWICYWLGNPALGQTTFWVVGEANYLWPLVFVSALIKYLLRFLNKELIPKKQYLLLIVLSILAGCSNEATGALVLYFLVLLYGWARINKLNNHKAILICFGIAFASFLVLLLAPGNMERAAYPEFAHWRTISLNDRITNHFINIIPTILKGYGIIYLVLFWTFVQAYQYIKKTDWQLITIFFSATFVFCVVLIASPHAGIPRTHLTGLFFLLVTVSFLLKEAFNQGVSKLGKMLFIVFFGVFIFSYSCIFLAYQSFYKQSNIRIAIIDKEKQRSQQQVTIPNYYKPFVMRRGDYPELDYHSPFMMGKYYGVKEVNLVFVDFNYEQLLNSSCDINYKDFAKSESVVDCIYIQKYLLAGITRFVIKFNPNIANIENYKSRFKLRVANTFDPSDEYYYEITLPLRIIKIDGNYFASIDTVTNLLALNIDPKLIVKLYGPVNLLDGSDSESIPVKVR